MRLEGTCGSGRTPDSRVTSIILRNCTRFELKSVSNAERGGKEVWGCTIGLPLIQLSRSLLPLLLTVLPNAL